MTEEEKGVEVENVREIDRENRKERRMKEKKERGERHGEGEKKIEWKYVKER